MEGLGTVDEWVGIAREQQSGADNCIPRFFMDAVPDPARTEAEGHQCFKEVAKVEIIIPGDKNNRPIHKVRDEHKQRWPAAWAKFEATRQETLDGTPIDQYPALSKAQVLEFKALGILTVESLAGLDDQGIQKIGPDGRKIRERARQYIQPAAETETELRKTIRDQGQSIAEMQTQIDTLSRQLAEAQDAKPKRTAKTTKATDNVSNEDSSAAD